MFILVACAGIDVVWVEILGEVKSRRILFQPGSR